MSNQNAYQQVDENIGLALTPSQNASYHIDENITVEPPPPPAKESTFTKLIIRRRGI